MVSLRAVGLPRPSPMLLLFDFNELGYYSESSAMRPRMDCALPLCLLGSGMPGGEPANGVLSMSDVTIYVPAETRTVPPFSATSSMAAWMTSVSYVWPSPRAPLSFTLTKTEDAGRGAHPRAAPEEAGIWPKSRYVASARPAEIQVIGVFMQVELNAPNRRLRERPYCVAMRALRSEHHSGASYASAYATASSSSPGIVGIMP
jgi:hypothetical protein